METFLLVTIIVLLAALALIAVSVARVLQDLRKAIKQLDRQIQDLKVELAKQEENLSKVKSVLAKRPEDPFTNLFDSIERFRTRGALATVAMIGARLFRAYLGSRPRRKALPQTPRPEETT